MKFTWTAKKIALCAVMTATLCVFKETLAFIPNVEVVTLLTSVYAYVFGWITIIPVIAFVLIEMAIWGVASWNISYFIFWSVVTVVFVIYGKKQIKNLLVIISTAVILTAFFGVLTSFFDICISGFNNFFYRFSIYYLRGIYFYIIHIVSNAIIFLFLFKPLILLLQKIKTKFI